MRKVKRIAAYVTAAAMVFSNGAFTNLVPVYAAGASSTVSSSFTYNGYTFDIANVSDIKLGEKASFDLDGSNKGKVYKFVPNESGLYYFSRSYDGSYVSYYFFDEKYNVVEYSSVEKNDHYYAGYLMEEGKTYYLGLTSAGESEGYGNVYNKCEVDIVTLKNDSSGISDAYFNTDGNEPICFKLDELISSTVSYNNASWLYSYDGDNWINSGIYGRYYFLPSNLLTSDIIVSCIVGRNNSDENSTEESYASAHVYLEGKNINITSQPEDIEVLYGDYFTVSVGVDYATKYNYSWYVSYDDGDTWGNCYSSSSLGIEENSFITDFYARESCKMMCLISDDKGNRKYTDVFSVNVVNKTPEIKITPSYDDGCYGFTLNVTGDRGSKEAKVTRNYNGIWQDYCSYDVYGSDWTRDISGYEYPYTYKIEVTQNNSTITAEINPAYELAKNNKNIIKMNLNTGYDEIDNANYYTFAYSFTPDKDGYYYFSCDRSGVVFDILSSDGLNSGNNSVYYLNAGKTYYIRNYDGYYSDKEYSFMILYTDKVGETCINQEIKPTSVNDKYHFTVPSDGFYCLKKNDNSYCNANITGIGCNKSFYLYNEVYYRVNLIYLKKGIDYILGFGSISDTTSIGLYSIDNTTAKINTTYTIAGGDACFYKLGKYDICNLNFAASNDIDIIIYRFVEGRDNITNYLNPSETENVTVTTLDSDDYYVLVRNYNDDSVTWSYNKTSIQNAVINTEISVKNGEYFTFTAPEDGNYWLKTNPSTDFDYYYMIDGRNNSFSWRSSYNCIYLSKGEKVYYYINRNAVAKVTSYYEPSIIKQPYVDNSSYSESYIRFDVDGVGLYYNWYISYDDKNFIKYDSSRYGSLNISKINGDFSVYCIASDYYDKKIKSDVFKFISGKINIIKQPESQNVAYNDYINLSVEIDSSIADSASYRWLYSNDGKIWYNYSSSNDISIYARESRQYKCMITYSGKTVFSDVAKITLIDRLGVATQPVDTKVKVGEKISFTTAANYTNAEYQWQYSLDGKKWINSGVASAKTNTYTFTTGSSDNMLVRCCISKNGNSIYTDAVKCIVTGCIKIISQPKSASVNEGGFVYFNVAASGANINYQWQYSYDGTNWKNSGLDSAKTSTYSFKASASDNFKVRCQINAEGKTAYTDVVTCQVTAPLKVISQPKSVITSAGNKVTFTVAANSSNVSYQWQYSMNGTSWINSGISAAKTNTYSFTASASDNMSVRCKISNSKETVYSDVVKCVIDSSVSIISQPKSMTVRAGSVATYTITISNTNNVSYQWQYSLDGTTWKNSSLSAAKTSKYTFTAGSSDNMKIRCIVTKGSTKVISNVVTNTVYTSLVVTKQPVSQYALVGSVENFLVEVNSPNVTYQWQYSVNGGTTWYNSGLASAKTAIYAFIASSGDNMKIRCKISDSKQTIYSDVVTNTIVKSLPAIISQPVAYATNPGLNASFSVKAMGNNLTYQWQWSYDGKTWKDSSAVSAKTSNYTFKTSSGDNNLMIRCIVKDTNNTVTSQTVKLTVTNAPVITKQPIAQTVKVSSKASFTVEATGSNLTYQWQWSYDGKTWNNSSSASAKTNNYTFTASTGDNNLLVRCIVKNSNGSATTNSAKLTVSK